MVAVVLVGNTDQQNHTKSLKMLDVHISIDYGKIDPLLGRTYEAKKQKIENALLTFMGFFAPSNDVSLRL